MAAARLVRPWTVVAFALFAPAAAASDWYVDASYASCSSSTGSAAQPFCTIQAAIAAASSGDTIHVAAGTYSGTFSVDRSLTILGTQGRSSTRFTGNGVNGIASIAAGISADFAGFTFQDGMTAFPAAVDLGAGSIVTFLDCSFENCVNHDGSAFGGAISTYGATAALQRCTLRNNSSYVDGGAIGVHGGSLTLVDCDLHDNVVGNGNLTGVSGGAIRARNGAVVHLERTGFTANGFSKNLGSDGSWGGAVSSSQSTVTALDCTFSDNDAGLGSGGAIHGDGISAFDCLFERNAAHTGGAIEGDGVTCERCRFVDNQVAGIDDHGGVSAHGGALMTRAGATIADCTFEGNVAHGIAFVGAGTAGALSISAPAGNPASVVRSRFARNRAEGSVLNGGIGGALHVDGHVALFDCEIVENVADGSQYVVAGFGGGVVLANSAAASLVRCTVAGNRADFQLGTAVAGGLGGGLFVGSACDLDHCVVAGNFAYSGTTHDVYGTVASLGWNDVGDTVGATISGPGTNDLLDVDPVFLDPTNGDWRLDPTSPCIDSGDATLAPSGRDVAWNPRLLDGDLDGALVLDRGAHEFSNVALTVTGSATPGGTLTFDTTGTAGMPVVLIGGVATSELAVKKFGALFVDLTAPFLIVPFGTIPNSQNVTVPSSLPVPLTVHLQEATLATGAGNLGNLVTLEIE